MAHVHAVKPNGCRVVSVFSGCGGSCLGYRLAGFNVLWASEFIPSAAEVYRANHPDSMLDTRDIRQVQPEEILAATKLQIGELDLFDGSPPCAAFSTAGKGHKGWGQVKAYSETAQRVDDLFFEYSRLLRGLQPKVFIAENVSGLVKGKAKGYFKLILRDLRACGYQVEARLLNAQWLGVPQMRERLIFIGVRDDLVERYGVRPAFPQPLPYFYTVGEALANLPPADEALCWRMPPGSKTRRLWEATIPGERGGMKNAALRLTGKASMLQHYRLGPDWPANTVCQGSVCLYHWKEPRSLNIAELKRICAFPDDFVLTGKFAQQWERLRILREIYAHTVKGGALVIVEKILGSTHETGELLVDLYYALKARHGYSPEQIARKRASLEGVLVPMTAKWNEELLHTAGFSQVECFWRYLNFAGWLAVKE